MKSGTKMVTTTKKANMTKVMAQPPKTRSTPSIVSTAAMLSATGGRVQNIEKGLMSEAITLRRSVAPWARFLTATPMDAC